jgi:hypothetical protein
MPMPARTVLPAKLATAEKHIGRRFLRCGKYMKFGGRRNVFWGGCDVGLGACFDGVH